VAVAVTWTVLASVATRYLTVSYLARKYPELIPSIAGVPRIEG